MAPSAFAQLLQSLAFSKADDRAVVGGLYQRALEDNLSEWNDLDYAARGWGDVEVSTLGACVTEIGCSSVTSLSLDDNVQLKSAECLAWLGEPGALPALEKLTLSGCGLTALPESIGELASLRILVLDGCALTAVPDTLARLRALRVFAFATGQIGYMPDLTSLTDLRVNGVGLGPDVTLPSNAVLRAWEEGGRKVWRRVHAEDDDEEDNEAFWAAMQDAA